MADVPSLAGLRRPSKSRVDAAARILTRQRRSKPCDGRASPFAGDLYGSRKNHHGRLAPGAKCRPAAAAHRSSTNRIPATGRPAGPGCCFARKRVGLQWGARVTESLDALAARSGLGREASRRSAISRFCRLWSGRTRRPRPTLRGRLVKRPWDAQPRHLRPSPPPGPWGWKLCEAGYILPVLEFSLSRWRASYTLVRDGRDSCLLRITLGAAEGRFFWAKRFLLQYRSHRAALARGAASSTTGPMTAAGQCLTTRFCIGATASEVGRGPMARCSAALPRGGAIYKSSCRPPGLYTRNDGRGSCALRRRGRRDSAAIDAVGAARCIFAGYVASTAINPWLGRRQGPGADRAHRWRFIRLVSTAAAPG